MAEERSGLYFMFFAPAAVSEVSDTATDEGAVGQRIEDGKSCRVRTEREKVMVE